MIPTPTASQITQRLTTAVAALVIAERQSYEAAWLQRKKESFLAFCADVGVSVPEADWQAVYDAVPMEVIQHWARWRRRHLDDDEAVYEAECAHEQVQPRRWYAREGPSVFFPYICRVMRFLMGGRP